LPNNHDGDGGPGISLIPPREFLSLANTTASKTAPSAIAMFPIFGVVVKFKFDSVFRATGAFEISPQLPQGIRKCAYFRVSDSSRNAMQ
jgi:hypothetical protein